MQFAVKTLLLLVFLSFNIYVECNWNRVGHINGMLGAPVTKPGATLPPDEWFDQQLDHFSPTDERTWKQRYFTNASFYVPGGPVFLMIGGEGVASPTWMVEGQWIEMAQKYQALCFQLEHRFYGKSHPTEDMSVKNLVYLSSEQALADLAFFIESMIQKHELDNAKWIAFGGSYPGSLAAWLRAKYPHLVHGSMSASGPLLAKVDFKEYFGVVQDSLSSYNEKCVKDVMYATKQLNILLKHRIGQKSINNLFKLCDPVDMSIANDISSLYDSLAGNFAEVVQYNKDHRRGVTANITINVVCDIMMNSSLGAAIDRYAAVSNLLLSTTNQTCLDYKYDKMIQGYQATGWESKAAEVGRPWAYQSCTEFGFYQTSSLNPLLFGDQFPIEYYVQQCADVFGPRFNAAFLRHAVDRTNTLYGAYALEVSRVVFVHGSIDPWHALGITNSTSPSSPSIYIQGTAHCANMYASSPSDPPQLIAARKKVSALIGKWLKE